MSSQKLEEDKRKNPNKYIPKEATSQFKTNGELRQCNEGNYKWLLNEHDSSSHTTFTVQISRFIDTSLIETNIYPLMVSARIKGTFLVFQAN